MKEAKNQSGTLSAKEYEAEYSGGESIGNLKVYMAALFLVGIVLGALIGYSYFVGQKPNSNETCNGVYSLNASILKNATLEAAALEKAMLFLNKEGLEKNGLAGKLKNATEIKAKLITFSILSAGQNVDEGYMYLINDTILVVGPYYNIKNYTPQTIVTPNLSKKDKPEVKFFVMSFCPYGTKFEEIMKPVAALLKDKITVEPHFVVTVTNNSAVIDNICFPSSKPCCVNASGTYYCSLHGAEEAKEDARQACILKKYGVEKWWEYVAQVNADCKINTIKDCWKTAATAKSIDTALIEQCVTDEGATLMANEQEVATIYDVRGSEYVLINDGNAPMAAYRWSSENLKDLICSTFNTAPAECNQALSEGSTGEANGGCGG